MTRLLSTPSLFIPPRSTCLRGRVRDARVSYTLLSHRQHQRLTVSMKSWCSGASYIEIMQQILAVIRGCTRLQTAQHKALFQDDTALWFGAIGQERTLKGKSKDDSILQLSFMPRAVAVYFTFTFLVPRSCPTSLLTRPKCSIFYSLPKMPWSEVPAILYSINMFPC